MSDNSKVDMDSLKKSIEEKKTIKENNSIVYKVTPGNNESSRSKNRK